jgi:hypothetical protein
MTYATITHPTPPSRHLRAALTARRKRPATQALMILAAALVVSSGAIHFYLWDIAYRHVATLGPLFLLQAISAVILALALVLLRWGVVIVAALGLMIGTLIGFVLVLTTGLFGFKLGFVSGWATLTLVAESLATVVLVTAGALLWRETA